MKRPFRFVITGSRLDKRADLLTRARLAEEAGYSIFGMADHFMLPFAPNIALQAAADATSEIRLTQVVLAEGFRHPAVLAKELATLDILSSGRLEIGIGAGWMQAEFDQAGIPFAKPSVRIQQLEEAIQVIKGLFAEGPCSFAGRHFTIDGLDGLPKPVQRPHPPIMVGGGGPKVLAAAARHADIVQILPGVISGVQALDVDALRPDSYELKVDLVRKEAGERFEDIELGMLLTNVTITDDADRALRDFVSGYGAAAEGIAHPETLLESPAVAIGTLDEVCSKLLDNRDRFGFSYISSPVGSEPSLLAPVIERLRGR